MCVCVCVCVCVCFTGIKQSKNNTATQFVKMPVLPIGTHSIRIHTIIDHSIIETIVNNRCGKHLLSEHF